MTSKIVCISQATGSLGHEIGHAVAEELKFRYVDEEIVARAAKREGVDPEDIADVEQRQTFVRMFLRSLERRAKLESVGRLGGALPLGTTEDYREAIRAVVRETAEQGEVVIVSHGASVALAEMPGLLRVMTTASVETRARRISEQTGITAPDAVALIKETDLARSDYLQRFYHVHPEEPWHYDIVLNTDVLGRDEAVSLIVSAARAAHP